MLLAGRLTGTRRLPLLPQGSRLTHSLNIFYVVASALSDTVCSNRFIETRNNKSSVAKISSGYIDYYNAISKCGFIQSR